MRNRNVFIVIAITLLFMACKSESSDKNKIVEAPVITPHYNIKIVSDLSNRLDRNLYPRQLDDRQVIGEVLRGFPGLIGNYFRMTSQKDKISYGLINPLEVSNFNDLKNDLTIDLGRFKNNQRERIEFIKNRSTPSLSDRIEAFERAIDEIYSKAESSNSYYTADTWGFFKQVVDEHYFRLSNPSMSTEAKDVSRNILIMISDGFIEISSDNSKRSCPTGDCRFLDVERLKKFREYYASLGSGISLKEAFDQSDFRITPVNNPNLKDVEVLILEVNGRAKTKTGRLTSQVSDFEILKLFWEDFLLNEGVKRVEVKNVQPTTDQIRLILDEFLDDKNTR